MLAVTVQIVYFLPCATSVVSVFSSVRIDQTIVVTDIPGVLLRHSVTVLSTDNSPHMLVRLHST